MKIGDIVHLNWTPQSGNEMAKNHYGVILSCSEFNQLIPRVMVAPITSKFHEAYSPLRVDLNSINKKVEGYICIDHLRAIDPETRNLKLIGDEISFPCREQCRFVLKKIFSV
ncbi:MAG: type II toxin-antitoxin system PemK/MazF family toxin [Bacteriovoracaceae bacterium]|nr:type II toxin-antitoxin system PemK/MazF family toxin [Bacteriovoracaceae bacterium]